MVLPRAALEMATIEKSTIEEQEFKPSEFNVAFTTHYPICFGARFVFGDYTTDYRYKRCLLLCYFHLQTNWDW